MIPLRILATGKALPAQAWTAQALDDFLGQPHGSTFQKSGVRLRHLAGDTALIY